MPDPTEGHRTLFARNGFVFEAEPQPFPLIARRSAVALSYGGHGFTSACLLAALPHMVVSFDLEKQLSGVRIAALGFGAQRDFYRTTPDQLAQGLEALACDTETAARLKAAAPGFHRRMAVSLEGKVSAAVAQLATKR
jgi:UDP:flavonoid glycosyltransferase YjiC (YdhE family)